MTGISRAINFRPLSQTELNASHDLIANLVHLSDTAAKLNGDKRATVKCTRFAVPHHTSAEVRAYKFNEFSYGKPNKPLPTNARGLFSYTDGGNRHQIVIRGYDKFFNTDEVPATQWSAIEEHTHGPYDLTLKQNGCIIFIGALPDRTILVTSKHSLGARQDMQESHAERGKRWLDIHLSRVGRTETELATVILDNQLTIVCELCDDSFEEHILGYPPEKSGLYLHGINRNCPIFSTYPITEVNSFAAEFGFLSNSHLVLRDLEEMRRLLQDCALTGTYQGTEVEGFVIRTKFDEKDFFFKYKFEEPYLLFRQWREVTKDLINCKEPQYTKHKAITRDYLTFIAPIVQDANTAKLYLENHGIIDLRKRFLSHKGVDLNALVAKSLLETAEPEESVINWSTDRFVIVPIATIGCGKTTIAVALQHLFHFGHVQNDNILAKRPAIQFAKDVYTAFDQMHSRVVVADRNNHMFHERESLIRDVRKLQAFKDPSVHFIALSFSQTPELRGFTLNRVLKRGDNHQSIRAATMSNAETKKIMDGFHHRFQPLDVSHVPDKDLCTVLEVNPLAGSRTNLEKVVRFLFRKGLISKVPSTIDLDEAILLGMNYAPTVYKHMTSHPSQTQKSKPKSTNTDFASLAISAKDQRVNYYALKIVNSSTVLEAIHAALNLHTGDEKTLKVPAQMQSQFHVTLIHESDKPKHKDIWEYYSTSKLGTKHPIMLKELVFDERVMAITIDQNNLDLPFCNAILHITVATADKSIKPFESNAMLERVLGSSEKTTIRTAHRIPLGTQVDCELAAFYV